MGDGVHYEYMRYQTPYLKTLRFRWYRLVERNHRSVESVCTLYGIPKKTYYKWYRRDHGLATSAYHTRLTDRKTKLTQPIRRFIEETKYVTNYGPLKMKFAVKRRFHLDVSTTIIYRYYQRRKLIQKPQRTMPWYEPLKEHLMVTRAGMGVQMDVKYVYPMGKRQYQFSALDPYTESYHCTIMETKTSNNAIVALQAAEKYFRFPITSVQTDNGSEFRGNLHTWLVKHQIPHYFIPKHSPYWNAQVERIHKTVDDEYYQNPRRTWKTIHDWLHFYNYERLHQTLNGLTPHEKVLQSVTLDC